MRNAFGISLTLGLALWCLAACTVAVPDGRQEEPLPILFQAPAVNPSTRTDAGYPNHEMPTTYNTAEHFSVYAMDASGVFSGLDATAKSRYYMNNEECEYVSTYNAWAPINGFYWLPAFVGTYYMNFQAYSPTVANEDCTLSHSWNSGFTFTGFSPRAVGQQYDLLYSDRHTDKQRPNYSGNPYDETTGDEGHDYNGIDIKFNHALTSIVFIIKAKVPEDAIQEIHLQKVSVKNVWSTGTFAQNIGGTAAWTIAPSAPETEYIVYQNTGAVTEGRHLYESNPAVPGDWFTIPNALMPIPQVLLHDKGTPLDTTDDTHVTIEITYTRTIVATGKTVTATETADLVNGNEGSYFQDSGNNSIISWEMGKRYTYNITLDLFKVLVDPSVSSWNDFTPGHNIDL